MAKEKSKTLKKKDISQDYSVFIFKYWTNHPRETVSKAGKKLWDPKFPGSYETVIGMQKQNGLGMIENTHPKASWYLSHEYFNRIFEKIENPDDFRTVVRKFGDYLTSGVDYKQFTKRVDNLIKRL